MKFVRVLRSFAIGLPGVVTVTEAISSNGREGLVRRALRGGLACCSDADCPFGNEESIRNFAVEYGSADGFPADKLKVMK